MKKRSERPAEYAAILLEIEKRFGTVTPKMVVELAKDENHPLHNHFEWRDDVAAQRFREDQARELIRSARLDIVVEEVPLSAIAFVRDPTTESHTQGYRSTMSLQGDRVSAIEVLAVEIRQAAALLKRSRDVAVSLGIDATVIESFQKSIEQYASELVTANATEAEKVA